MLPLRRLLLALCACLGLNSQLEAQTPNGPARPVLRVGFNASPPLAYFKDDGAPDGLIVRLAHRLFAKAAQPAEIGIYPAPRLFKSLQDGELDLSMLAHADALEDCCLFSQLPVMTHVVRVYWLGKQMPVRSKEELVGKSLIVLHGYSYAGLINFVQDESSHIRLETAKTSDAALQMLNSGRADYLLAYEVNMQEATGERLPKGMKSEILGRFPVHLVLNKNYPDASRAMARLENLVRELDAGR